MIILLILLYLASKEWLLPPPSYLRDLIYKCSLSKGPILWGMVDVQEFLRVTVSDMIIFFAFTGGTHFPSLFAPFFLLLTPFWKFLKSFGKTPRIHFTGLETGCKPVLLWLLFPNSSINLTRCLFSVFEIGHARLSWSEVSKNFLWRPEKLPQKVWQHEN